jgi:subtilisin family serine protease
MKTVLTSAFGSLTLLFALSSQAAAPAEQLQKLRAEAESGAASKLTSTLLALKDLPRTVGVSRARSRGFALDEALGIRNGYVLVAAYGPDPEALRVELEAKGLIRAKVHSTSVSGRAPVERIAEMAEIPGLTYMKQSMPELSAGLVTSQGDKSLYSDLANFYGTSAAAPHVAAVAALLLDQRARDIAADRHFIGPKILTPDLIIAALRLSAVDIKRRALDREDATKTQPIRNGEGFDFDSGFGLVNAQKALELTKGF